MCVRFYPLLLLYWLQFLNFIYYFKQQIKRGTIEINLFFTWTYLSFLSFKSPFTLKKILLKMRKILFLIFSNYSVFVWLEKERSEESAISIIKLSFLNNQFWIRKKRSDFRGGGHVKLNCVICMLIFFMLCCEMNAVLSIYIEYYICLIKIK